MMSEATESVRSSKQLPANINGIPEMLSFDRIINNGTCPVSHFTFQDTRKSLLILIIS